MRIGNAQTPPDQSRTPVLVELFTSEGCSSCPPADALLAKLSRDQPVASAQIIILGEHVDYWDQLGWHDRFSSAQYTERQRQYGTRFKVDDIYTPQMVVNGSEQFVGNDAAHALRAIAQASRPTQRSSSPSLNPWSNGHRVSASVSTADAALANYRAISTPRWSIPPTPPTSSTAKMAATASSTLASYAPWSASAA